MAEEMLMDSAVEAEELDSALPESGEQESNEIPGKQEPAEGESPYSTKYSKEMRAAIKALEAQHPESAKFLKAARDSHARQYALNEIEPKGIDGVRDTYSLVNSLARGEAKGVQALTSMQEDLATYEESDELIAKGDPRALDGLGKDFDAGLAKLAPKYLERVQKADPQAFESAVTPYFVAKLAQSDMVREYNALVDVLNSQGDPRFDDKTKMSFAIQQLSKMGKWMNELAAGATAPAAGPAAATGDQPDQQAEIERERKELHWERNIYPAAGKAVEDKFNELLKPLQGRLKLSETQRKAAFEDFKAKNTKLCEADKEYTRQRDFYRNQKKPDAAQVLNMVKAQLAKPGARQAFDQVKAERWEAFLAAKPKIASAANGNGAKPTGPVPPNVEIRSVKPPMNEINHRATPIEWLPLKQYRLNNGKIIRVVPN